MRDFDLEQEALGLLTPEVLDAVALAREARARVELRRELAPARLDTLREHARIQSAGASNRLENISTSDARLHAIVGGTAEPRTRDEREIAGYRFVLDLIHENHEHMEVTPNVILQLHRDLYRYTDAAHAGRWKDGDNVIVGRGADGATRVRFVPPSALETPDAVTSLCASYTSAEQAGRMDPLLLSALFTFDFVSIHPFNDGNGRLSRLLSLLTLYRGGYDVGRYVSIEAEIERSKATYYEALERSSAGWREGAADYLPFATYYLGVVLACYRELDRQLEALTAGGAAYDVVRACLKSAARPLSKREIMDAVPLVSQRSTERALARLQEEGLVEKVGAARATRYRWVGGR